MHLSYTLLIAISSVIILANGNVSATASGSTRELSALVSQKVVASIDTNVGGEKRFLRSTGRLRYRRKRSDETDSEPLVEDEDEADSEPLVEDEDEADKEDPDEEDFDEEDSDEEDSGEEETDDAEGNGDNLF